MPSVALAQEGTRPQSDRATHGTATKRHLNSGPRCLCPVVADENNAAMHYVYLMESHLGHRYVGFTENLRQRLTDHNDGRLPNTKRYRPWKLQTYLAFSSKKQALTVETYLKSGSGHAFARRHLWPG